MQNDDIDQIEKTISEYREAFFDAMLNRHYTHSALYMKCMNAFVPSELKLKLESIEAAEANLMSNENATDYAKRLLSKWID
jgi:hypothetical protein